MMAVSPQVKMVTLAGSAPMLPIALGGSWYDKAASDADIIAALEASYDGGIRHFDTASGYAGGQSEIILGQFLKRKGGTAFVASKADPDDLSAAAMEAAIDASLRRLAMDQIDLYYIHWPHAGRDMRPRMEGLERARRAGKIGGIGVSNFKVAQLQQVSEVARPDVHQLGFNLLWRYAEAEIIPYCAANGIAVVAYSPLAHGILTGKFGADLTLADGDQRHTILPFRADIWPHVHAGVEQMAALARGIDLPLASLAIRWILAQPGITSVVAGARNRQQATANLAALSPAIGEEVLSALTALSDDTSRYLPDVGNLFGHYP